MRINISEVFIWNIQRGVPGGVGAPAELSRKPHVTSAPQERHEHGAAGGFLLHTITDVNSYPSALDQKSSELLRI